MAAENNMVAMDRQDPLVSFHFGVEVQGEIAGYFTEVSGLGSEHEIIEHKVVNEKGVESVMKIPGRLKWGDITLKRGITKAMDLWNWRKRIEDGNVKDARHNASIIMFDQNLDEVARWDLANCWPSKVSGPTLGSDKNEIVVEEMTLVCENQIRVQ